MSPHPSPSPPQSTIDMSLWTSNTATNILLNLISDMEIKIISDIHLLFNERNIKHKHKNIQIQPSHLLYNVNILLHKFQTQFLTEISNFTSKNNTILTANMDKIKQNPHLFPTLLKTPKQFLQPPRNILQISSHNLIHHQLKNLYNDIIFVDTETDGLSTYKSNLLSICLTSIKPTDHPSLPPTYTEHLFYIKPNNSYSVNTDSQAYKINQISQATLNLKGSSLPSIAPLILDLLTSRIVVGFNINSFDIPIIRNNLKRINITLPPLMTIDLYQAHHKIAKHDLSSALKDLRCYPIAQDSLHSANGDTDACIRLLAAFTEDLQLPLTKNSYLSQHNTNNKHQIFQTNI